MTIRYHNEWSQVFRWNNVDGLYLAPGYKIKNFMVSKKYVGDGDDDHFFIQPNGHSYEINNFIIRCASNGEVEIQIFIDNKTCFRDKSTFKWNRVNGLQIIPGAIKDFNGVQGFFTRPGRTNFMGIDLVCYENGTVWTEGNFYGDVAELLSAQLFF